MKIIFLTVVLIIFISCERTIEYPIWRDDIDTVETVDAQQIFPDEDPEETDISDNDIFENTETCNDIICNEINKSVCIEHNGKPTCVCDEGFYNYYGKCVKSYLVLALSQGYYEPFGGHVYIAENENIESISELNLHYSLGSEMGTDLALATSFDRIMVVGRHHASNIVVYIESYGDTESSQTLLESPFDNYVNFHDVVYSADNDVYIAAANHYDSLMFFEENNFSEISLSTCALEGGYNPSPSKMHLHNNKLFVTLQMLDENWTSHGGGIGVVNIEDRTVSCIELPFKNPYGKLLNNRHVDKDHLYLMVSGSYNKRDGGLVRINLKDYTVDVLLEESSEENSILDADFIDAVLTDSGEFYFVVSNNRDGWTNKLLHYTPENGVIEELDRGLNAFAANPLEYSPVTKRIYYFKDIKEKTYLVSYSFLEKTAMLTELEMGPAAVKIWFQQ